MPKEVVRASFSNEMDRFYRRILRPLLFRVDPERAHRLAMHALPLIPAGIWRRDHSLPTTLLGISFTNPIGLAAGFDKDGIAAQYLPRLGFGFIELGTVTPEPQPGNEKPRLFRYPHEKGLVNRMGFNNEGGDRLARRIARLRERGELSLPVGVNIGKQKETPPERAADDYKRLIRAVQPVADYLVVNVSSPNTPGLRNLEKADLLRELLQSIRRAADEAATQAGSPPPPLLVKLSPDMIAEELEGSAAAALEVGMDALVVSNTTTDLSSLGAGAPREGGLSGEPLRRKALEALRIARGATSGSLPLIGSGGIMNAEDAYRRIRAGASLVQVYTGLIYEGPGLIRKIVKRLPELMARDGFSTVEEAVGTEE